MTVGGVVLVMLGGIALSGGNGFGWVLLGVGVLLLVAGSRSHSAVEPSQPSESSAEGFQSDLPHPAAGRAATVVPEVAVEPILGPATAPPEPPVAEQSEPQGSAAKKPAAKKPAAKRPPANKDVSAAGSAQIVTRTTSRPGQPNLIDPFAGIDRSWSAEEERRLLVEYAKQQDLAALAITLRIDMKEAAKRLIRLLFETTGDLEAGDPPRNGARWTQLEFEQALRDTGAGLDLAVVAARLDRTQLGVGWRLLERAPRPLEPSKQTRVRLGSISS